MPSFDIVSKIDLHEITNAVDQANREVATRFDFKGTQSSFTLAEDTLKLLTETDFQLKQMKDILESKLAKRQVDLQSLDYQEPELALKKATQNVRILQGIEQDKAKEIIKFIKEAKLKVQASIQGDQVRVTGKKRDDLQEVMAFLRKESFKVPLQFENFRD